MSRRGLAAAAVFLGACALLGFALGRAGIAEPFSDPVARIRAQDESNYANAAATAAKGEGWLTPKVLGRYYLVKPPLLIWLAGLSVKLFGMSAFALRLPVLLAGGIATVLLFLWAERAHSRGAAVMACLLLAANPLWHTFARLCYTDMLLAMAMAAALYAALRDPLLAGRRAVLVFGVSTGVGIMAKNVAGLLPVAILALSMPLAARRPPLRAMLKICAVGAAVAAPWHVYQLIAHPRWFFADYVQVQLLNFGAAPPAQSSGEGQAWFYLKRLALLDPLLCALALAALPALLAAVRRRKNDAALLLSWLLVAGAALLAFRYRNLPYLLYAIPPLCLTASCYGPLAAGRRRAAAIALIAAAFAAKAFWNDRPWGLPYGPQEPLASARPLREYAALRRPNELILVDSDDEFFAATLALPRVRYCFIDPAGVVERYAPHYAHLGITVRVEEFAEIGRREPEYRARLRAWGLDSSDPVATAIVAKSPDGVASLIAAHPGSDFYLPAALRAAVESGARSHRLVPASQERVFLLALR